MATPDVQEESTHLDANEPITPLTPATDVGFVTPTTPTMHIETALESSPWADDNYSERTASPEPATPTAPVTPATPQTPTRERIRDGDDDSYVAQEAHMSMASLASIPLSESSLDYDHLSPEQVEECLTTPKASGRGHGRKPSSLEILQNVWQEPARQSTLFDSDKDAESISLKDNGDFDSDTSSVRSSTEVQTAEAVSIRSNSTSISVVETRSASGATTSSSARTPTRASSLSGSFEDDEEQVDWSQLERDEQQEKEDKSLPEGVEDDSTKFLLARLEQENAMLASDPKSKTHASRAMAKARSRSQSRPPSIAQLKKMVKDRDAPSIRYSIASSTITESEAGSTGADEPPPMTELEFWAALVQDYPSTASRLPTLTSSKIRAGIPPPLRGVVWTSMSGARDRHLEAAYEKLLHEKSPYEGIINKDVGRSFPGVELFRDAEGEGQKMLGRVLKCFSLHDKDIGYCQGLGFLVGPLLMNMGERDAFCVLVRLMDNFSLRPSFLPSLSGLHMRIFQFSSLLKQHQPELSAHLTELGVEPAYLSQWFLSCFAVTCPLPMLFRIYDVIFAEGANETVMRVALALMRRNEDKMIVATEFEEVMQLLLGRGIWDVYGCSADELVDDFTSLGNIITHERLAELEREFESQSGEDVGKSAGFLPDVQAAASRFLGRLWAPSHGPSKSTSTLSPPAAEANHGTGLLARPASFLRRSPSKQSISTLNDSEGTLSSGSGSASLASTVPTEPDVTEGAGRESAADTLSLKSKPDSMRTGSISIPVPPTPTGFASSKEQQDLHGQIEDLLTALSEMQREHAQLAAMLQKEREDRSEDHRVVRQLVGRLKVDEGRSRMELKEDRRRTMPPPSKRNMSTERPESTQLNSAGEVGEPTESNTTDNDELNNLLEKVDTRLQTNSRISASFETKAQLKSTLTRTREQLEVEQQKCRELAIQLEGSMRSQTTFELEAADLRDQVADLRVRTNEEFGTRQKLEQTVRELRAEAKKLADLSRAEANGIVRRGSLSSVPGGPAGGLRELRLSRRDSHSSVQSIRSLRAQRLTEPPSQNGSRPPSPGNTPITLPAAAPAITTSEVVESPNPATPASATALPAPTPNPTSTTTVPTAILAPAPQLTRTPSPPHLTHTPKAASLSVPTNTSDKERAVVWGRRTSSLATQQVLATPAHEPANEDALLVELVSAKTAEATARQELDEMKRKMNIAKRQHETAIAQMQLEMANAIAEAHAAAAAAAVAKGEAEASKNTAAAAGGGSVLSLDNTVLYDSNASSNATTPMGTPGVETPSPDVKLEKEAPQPKAGGGWNFWSRRTPSTSAVAGREG